MVTLKKDWHQYNGGSYNKKILGAMSKDEFMAHEAHNFPDTEEGRKQLEELYTHLQPKEAKASIEHTGETEQE